jgi:hypothetical protein
MSFVERHRFVVSALQFSQKLAGNKKWAVAHWSASPNEFSIAKRNDEVEA